MPRLDFYTRFKPFLSVLLDRDEILIGRGPECQVQLMSDQVSRQHLRLRTEGGAHVLENLSRNGTRVNSSMVLETQLLQAGDRVYPGDYVFVYQPDEAPVAELQRDQTTEVKAFR